MEGIWPERVVALPTSPEKDRRWLVGTQLDQVLAVVAPGRRNLLEKPVVLDSGKVGVVCLIALAVVGKDGIGYGSLVLRVTNERFFDVVGPIIRLQIIPYALRGESDQPHYRPDMAGDLLDGLVAKLRAIPGLVRAEVPDL